MILIYFIVWEILALLDFILTYKYLLLTKNLFPNIDYKQGERNPLPRFFIQKLGLLYGLVVYHSIVIFIIFFCSLFLELLSFILPIWSNFAFGVIVGINIFVVFVNNYQAVRQYKFLLTSLDNKTLKTDVEQYLKCIEKQQILWIKLKKN